MTETTSKNRLVEQSRAEQSRAEQSRAEQSIIVIGDIYEDNGHGSAGGRVYSIDGIAPAMGASHFQQVKYVLEVTRI